MTIHPILERYSRATLDAERASSATFGGRG